ncbi:MAG: ChaN family lipoprotein [Candidatus Delongbacteria bacterium]|nr:ChaN family lipoprotein [Candidatus Delongbacteria bacterium]
MKRIAAILIMIWSVTMTAQQNNSYRIYDADLKPIDYAEVVKRATGAEVVFFGETHNSKASHDLELQIIKDLHAAKGGKLVIGAEMFESDNQLVIDEYLAGFFDDSKFEADARLWPNYKTDYKPILQFAREKKLRFIATNIPRRYASMVNYGGFEALNKLSKQAKTYIADFPVKFDPELSGYKMMIKSMGGMGGSGHVKMDPVNLAKAQAIKDATMSQFIFRNMKKGELFFQFNGSYHSYNYEGIMWYLKLLNKDLKVYSITVVDEENLNQSPESYKHKADVIIVLPKDSPKSY